MVCADEEKAEKGHLTILIPEHPEASVGDGKIGAENDVQASAGGGVGGRGCVPTECTNQRCLLVWAIIQLEKQQFIYQQKKNPLIRFQCKAGCTQTC